MKELEKGDGRVIMRHDKVVRRNLRFPNFVLLESVAVLFNLFIFSLILVTVTSVAIMKSDL